MAVPLKKFVKQLEDSGILAGDTVSKAKALKVFLSVNGDSNVARNRMASQVRKFFEDTNLEPEDVQRWKKGVDEIETVRVVPPKISGSYQDMLIGCILRICC